MKLSGAAYFFGALSTDEFKQFAAQSGVSCLSPQADCHPALRLLAVPGPRALMEEIRGKSKLLGRPSGMTPFMFDGRYPFRNYLLSITWVPSSMPEAGDTGMSCSGRRPGRATAAGDYVPVSTGGHMLQRHSREMTSPGRGHHLQEGQG